MSSASAETTSEWLRRWRNLEECLLHEIRISPDLYEVVLKFNYVWGTDGLVRDRVLEEPVLLTLRLIGVEELGFVGALTDGMKQHPERIDWGLTEVAAVRARPRDGQTELSVEWESERRLVVRCLTIKFDDTRS